MYCDCKRIKKNYHACRYCNDLICVRCEVYEKIKYTCKNKDDGLVCIYCLGHNFEHFQTLYCTNEAKFHRGVLKQLIQSVYK